MPCSTIHKSLPIFNLSLCLSPNLHRVFSAHWLFWPYALLMLWKIVKFSLNLCFYNLKSTVFNLVMPYSLKRENSKHMATLAIGDLIHYIHGVKGIGLSENCPEFARVNIKWLMVCPEIKGRGRWKLLVLHLGCIYLVAVYKPYVYSRQAAQH